MFYDKKSEVPGPYATLTDGYDPDVTDVVPKKVRIAKGKFIVTTVKIAKGKGALPTENYAGRYGLVLNDE